MHRRTYAKPTLERREPLAVITAQVVKTSPV
jgi:hypothetical protein